MATYDPVSYTTWTRREVAVPTGARSAATLFRWRQLSHSGADYDHWALDDVAIATGELRQMPSQRKRGERAG